MRLLDFLVDLPGVEALAGAAQPAVGDALRSRLPRGFKDALHGVGLGHPLHPVLTDIPIGCWTTAAVWDALAAARRAPAFGAAADAAVGVGLLGAGLAALTGLADWSETFGRPRRVGLLHAGINVTATLLYAAAFALRKSQRTTGVGLSFGAYAVAVMGAYLGGELVYGERIGVDHAAAADDLPAEWTDAMALADLGEGKPRSADVAGVRVVLVRQNGRVTALGNACSHLGEALAEGSLEDGTIRCPWHGSRFRLADGTVAEGPATRPVPAFETRVRDGRIQLRSARARP